MKKIAVYVNIWRLWVVYLLLALYKGYAYEDARFWWRCYRSLPEKASDRFKVGYLLVWYPEYRNLLDRRLKQSGCSYVGRSVFRVLFPLLKTLYVHTDDIGPRLFIQHGFSTIISAKKIGSDCWINQQVTIGHNAGGDPPVIGNGVRICAGAKVIGPVTLGDNCVVGANGVVVKDVPSGEVWGGVPAKRIK